MDGQTTTTPRTGGTTDAPPVAPPGEAPLVREELLVEEVSIDGMCGVY